MKTFIVLLFVLFFMPGPIFGDSSDVERTMVVPFNEKCLSDLTYVIEDTAHLKIYASLTALDELKIYDDLQLLDNMESVKNLKIFLNSFGGGAYAGFAIADQIRRMKDRFKISIHASGVVASAAVMVFIAVEDRYASEDMFFMVHEIAVPSTAGMNASDVKSMDRLFDKLTSRYIENLVKHSNKTKEEWQEMLKEETWFSAQEALEWGLVKEVK